MAPSKYSHAQPAMPERDVAQGLCRDFTVINGLAYCPAFCLLAVKSDVVTQEDLDSGEIGTSCPCCKKAFARGTAHRLLKLACCDQAYHKVCAVKLVQKSGPQKCKQCRAIITPADSAEWEQEETMPNLRDEMLRRDAEDMVDGFFKKPAVLQHAEDLWNSEQLGRHASAAEAYHEYGLGERSKLKREMKEERNKKNKVEKPLLGVYKWKGGGRWIDLPPRANADPVPYYQDDPEKVLRRKHASRLQRRSADEDDSASHDGPSTKRRKLKDDVSAPIDLESDYDGDVIVVAHR